MKPFTTYIVTDSYFITKYGVVLGITNPDEVTIGKVSSMIDESGNVIRNGSIDPAKQYITSLLLRISKLQLERDLLKEILVSQGKAGQHTHSSKDIISTEV